MDMANFLIARAEEVVPGGLVAIVVPACPNGTPHDQVIFNMMFDLLGSCLMELSIKILYRCYVGSTSWQFLLSLSLFFPTANQILTSVQGLIDEEKVDSFNIPAYCTRPQELEAVIQKNGCFTIESIESLPSVIAPDTHHRPRDASFSIRAITQELIREHFGAEIVDELFDLFTNKVAEAHQVIASGTSLNLLVLLKRKTYS
ncbi:unnamed protein product [Fraxinus pennsylvanica]|uniref:SAM dependent carboxyl methyltransferase n=1 Tax=Fraxinus pennsylvanica TaxID=56036 RepID=A0AAD1YPX5_9LAMI|nr:unnamed protein product [Fraxinus pennsylvanica]